MQMRLLLVAMLAVSVALAGCAENNADPGSGGGDATPPAAVSNAEAQALFASAAGNVPDRFGMDMVAKNATSDIMTAHAVYDEPAQTTYFAMEMDPALFEDMGEGMAMAGAEADAFRHIAVYMSPQGNAFKVNDSVMLSAPEEGQFEQATGDQEGFSALSDPEEFLGELNESEFTVKSVTPTTLRGKGALKLDATVVEDGVTQNMSVWLFQNPTRIARIESQMPAAGEDEDEPDPFAGSTMVIDMLYEGEVTLQVPSDIQRALGLRYESDRPPFSFGGDGEGPETWTFQVDGGIALSEVQAEVGDMEGEAPAWTMLLSESPKTQDGLTLAYTDADADGKISANDTLVLTRGDEDVGSTVSLRDSVTGLRVVPGFGLLFAALALGAALAVSRRR